ncbi:MAG: hypothetical protein QOE47_2219 [Pyrinomonadaceae bacterium]|jgi:ABC-type cobalt transport system substrate-binding protein|nr:hypothetical protein [Pyrinomonadaceae bacterium]
MRRTHIPLLLVALIIALPASPVAATTTTAATEKGAEYSAVVKLIETHYKVKHRGIPFVANLGAKTAKVVSKDARRVLRFGTFKLAIFEDQDFSGRDSAAGDIRARFRQTLEPEWHPLVAVRLEEEGQTYTYTKADGDKFKVLIVIIGQRDATVLQVNLNPEEFAKLLLNPERESRELTNEATSVEQ